MRGRMTAGAALLAGAGLAACGGSDAISVTNPSAASTSLTSSSTAPPGGTSTSSSPTAAAKLGDGLKAGDCVGEVDGRWNTLDCDTGHKYEVSAIVGNSQFPHDLAARGRVRQHTCDKAAITYLGGPIVVSNFDSKPLPAALDTAQASRVVCLVFGYNTDRTDAGIGMKRMKSYLTSAAHADKTRNCLKTVAGGELVFCNEQHEADAVSLVWLGVPGDPPLTVTSTRAMAQSRCAKPVRSYLGGVTRKDVVPKLAATGAAAWNAGHTYGICFATLAHGSVNRPIHGIGTKPLADYRD